MQFYAYFILIFYIPTKPALNHIAFRTKADDSPVRPVEVGAEDGHGEQVDIGGGHHDLAALTSLKVDALYLVCAGVAPV